MLKKLLLGIFIFFILVFAVEGIIYYQLTKKLPWQAIPLGTPKLESGEYLTLENVSNYVSPDENTYRGYLIPGRTFAIVEQKGEWAKISVYEPHFKMSWEGWIKVSQTAYKLKE